MLRKLLTPFSIFLFFANTNTLAENDTFATTHFSGSGNCAMCHDNLTDNVGEDVSIVKDWGASMMAHAAKDPFWQAKVATELKRNPQLTSVINDTCTKCHAPMANYEINQSPNSEVVLFGPDGILNISHPLHDAAMNGVSCTLCHQIMDDASLGSLDGFSGQYSINQSKTIYGQYSDIFSQPMVNNTGYSPEYSAHISDSALCATCHNLKTPYVDAAGKVLTSSAEAEFPEQMPYTEWENSSFADDGSTPASCQDCHMPKTTAEVSNRPNWLNPKDGFAKHHFAGANTVMLTLLRDNAQALDVTTQDLDLGIDRARAMLRSAANLEILSAEVVDGMLEVQVKVTNASGHKAPTAYPSRRMWLHLRVSDSSDNILFESGRMQADGSIEGADNDQNPALYEPHYDLITAADQVQIYETVMADSDGNTTFTLLRAARYLKDNRLTPQGFDKLSVPEDVAVSGAAFADENFNLGSDVITYRVPINVAGELSVGISLNYQPLAHAFVQDLYQEADLPEVQNFRDMYVPQVLKHEVVASTQTTVINELVIAPPPPAPVVPEPTLSFSASPASVSRGDSITLSWSATDADSCTASGDWSGDKPIAGAESVVISDPVTFTLTCSGDGGSASGSLSYEARGRRWLSLQ